MPTESYPHELDGRSEPLARKTFSALHRTMLLHRQLMSRKLSEHGVRPAQALCIKQLGHHDGITQRDLAELLLVSRPTVTVMLKKMERSGLVTREVDESDQRFTRIRLTEKGNELHERMHAAVDDIIVDTIGRLPAADQIDLERLLRSLGAVMEAAIETAPPLTDIGAPVKGEPW